MTTYFIGFDGNSRLKNMHEILKIGDSLYYDQGLRRQVGRKCGDYAQFCYVTRDAQVAHGLTLMLENDYSRMKDLLRVDVCLDVRNDETVYFIIMDFNKRKKYG